MDSSPHEYLKYGYDADNSPGINARFKCPFCLLIIRDPIQANCGHRSCRSCFEVRADADLDENITCPYEDCEDPITNKSEIMPDRAFKRELDSLQIVCIHRRTRQCLWTGELKDYQAHLDENHIHFICPECTTAFSSQIALDEHVTKTCPSLFQLCPLAPYCTEDMIRKTEMTNHLHSEKHQETITKFLIGEYKYSETIDPEQEAELNRQRQELEEQISSKTIHLSKEVNQSNDTVIQLNEKFEHSYKDVDSLRQDINRSYTMMNEKISIKQTLQPNQDKLQKDIEQVQQLCQENFNISTDGTLTWRVTNVSEKMADAQSERQTSIYSPEFYSSPTGYKMRVRLFLFGDGNARRTHMSLFFLLMKGEYDAILKWPFHYKVTFCLLDQTGNNRHIIDSFHPDVKSNSFQRPKDNANIASGIPKFFPLPMLLQDDNAYVREDTLYIRVIIALNDTPKTMLPYMLTLNPALPTFVQEHMINQEIIKRQQQSNTASGSQTTSMNTGK